MLLKNVGLQLYSLRDEMAKDFRGTVEKVAKMGYAGVEFAGYGDLKPAEMAQAAQGQWTGGLWLPHRRSAQDRSGAGRGDRDESCRRQSVPSSARGRPWRRATTHCASPRCSTRPAAKLRPHGLKLGYHNHAHEFVVDGGEVLMDTVLGNVEPDIFAEFDVSGSPMPAMIRCATSASTPVASR